MKIANFFFLGLNIQFGQLCLVCTFWFKRRKKKETKNGSPLLHFNIFLLHRNQHTRLRDPCGVFSSFQFLFTSDGRDKRQKKQQQHLKKRMNKFRELVLLFFYRCLFIGSFFVILFSLSRHLSILDAHRLCLFCISLRNKICFVEMTNKQFKKILVWKMLLVMLLLLPLALQLSSSPLHHNTRTQAIG